MLDDIQLGAFGYQIAVCRPRLLQSGKKVHKQDNFNAAVIVSFEMWDISECSI